MCVMLNVFLIFTNKRKINRNKNYNELIRITCCIKSFTCMLIGICIDDNHKSLNQKKKHNKIMMLIQWWSYEKQIKFKF